MVSPSKPKLSRVANQQKTTSSYRVKLVKGTKPLIYHKFYLDIEKHNIATKIENRIKELGGSIEFFLNKDITHFITDKSNTNISSLTSNLATQPKTPTTPQTPRTPHFGNELPSVSSPIISSTNDNKTQKQPRSRADAMLQRARLQSNNSSSTKKTQSPVQQAKNWGTPIWTTEYAIKFLDKINESLKAESVHNPTQNSQTSDVKHLKKSPKVKTLKGDFIKIESFQKYLRPVYQEFKKWPVLNLQTKSINSPFDSEIIKKQSVTDADKAVADRMTRKSRAINNNLHLNNTSVKSVTTKLTTNTNTTTANTKQCGYCEICRIEYDVLTVHLKSDEHINFVKNDSNFLALDKLICSGGATVEAFLKFNSDLDQNNIQMFGRRSAIHHHPHNTLNHHNHQKHKNIINKKLVNDVDMTDHDHTNKTDTECRNSRRSSNMGLKNSSVRQEALECDLDLKDTKRISLGLRQNPKRANNNEDLSVEDANSRSLRLRRESCKRVDYAEPKEEDENSSQDESTGNIKVRGIRWRAPSPQSRPPIKLPLLYKVIDDSKAKSKGSNLSNSKNESNVESGSTKNGIIVKIKRVRQSELNRLNNEAENFMFPKKEDSDTDDDRQTTSEGVELSSGDIASSDRDKPTVKMEDEASDSEDENLKLNASRRKRNQSEPHEDHDEETKKLREEFDDQTERSKRHNKRLQTFLQENVDYYKFEEPESRLRFQDAPIQPEQLVVSEDENNCISEDVKNALDELYNESPSSPYAHQDNLSNCGKNIINFIKGKEDGMGVFKWINFKNRCDEIKPYKFAFERVPCMEPWYEAFQRQDVGTQKVYEYYGNTAYRKLPFELGHLPPLKPNCCILNYKIKTEGQTSSASSCVSSMSNNTSCTTSTTTTTTNLIKAENTTKINLNNVNNIKNSKSSKRKMDEKEEGAVKTEERDKVKSKSKSKTDLKTPLPLKKRKLLIDIDRPRKSPREHASTLAILSSLLQQQRKKGFSPTKREHTVKETPPETPKVEEDPLAVAVKTECVEEVVVKNEEEIVEPTPTTTEPEKQQEDDNVSNHSMAANSEYEEVKIKFDPPVFNDNAVDFKAMCNELDEFLTNSGELDEEMVDLSHNDGHLNEFSCEIKKDLVEIFTSCDDEPPLTIKQVMRGELLIRKNVLHDKIPRSILDGGSNCNYRPDVSKIYGFASAVKKRKNNRTGWPNKRKIVTRKTTSAIIKEEENETEIKADEDEDDEPLAKLDVEEENVDIKSDILTEEDSEDDNDDSSLEKDKPAVDISSCFFETAEEFSITTTNRTSSRLFPNCSKYVTKTTNTMTRVDYTTAAAELSTTELDNTSRPLSRRSRASCVTIEDDDKECDSISSRSIFVSDDCDTTTSTLINVFDEQSNSKLSEININNATNSNNRTMNNRSSASNCNKKLNFNSATATPPTTQKTLQPIVCIEKLNYSNMRTRSCSKSPQKTKASKTSKRNKKPTPKMTHLRATVAASASSSSPNKFSPRKLRKPRGRWYRER